MTPRLEAALARARDDLARWRALGPGARAAAAGCALAPEGRPRRVRAVLGDPQAPLERALAVLDARGLLGPDGRLAPDALLVSIGDHFDFGGWRVAEAAGRDGLALLLWLAAHPPDQVVLLAGNHDLARVGELVGFDAADFARARAEAGPAYEDLKAAQGLAPASGPGGLVGVQAAGVQAAVVMAVGDFHAREAEFLRRWPTLPSLEAAARDLAAFEPAQRDLVAALLRARRLRLAWAAAPDLLVVHAGVTAADLAVAGWTPRRAPGAGGDAGAAAAADALDAALDAAVAAWDGRAPLALPGLHTPGDAAGGEGGGVLYHRPADPARFPAATFEGPRRRRYDPRRLPAGLTQVVGHVRDPKCRELMPAWHDGAPARDGPLRALVADDAGARYAHGTPGPLGPGERALVFTDGGMSHAAPADYELFDLDRRAPLAPGALERSQAGP